ncbi:cytochrome-c peroxidase [Wielerella bovis]|uniref:cytochrome-c peroxidase n=1 Tax=Wielerella bovis TaxID=2917790 RepID=UPI002018B787|nr:cytochrome c peroxidase [Wielerella bovis]ULJ60904.1 c-type cytochrome [Wielerella bovis]
MNHKTTTFSLLFTMLALGACTEPLPAPSSASSASTASSSVNSQSVSAEDAQLLKQAQSFFQPLPSLEETKKSYAYTDEQVKLGQQLWYEPRLSVNDSQSCNTCHSLTNFGADDRMTPTSEGAHKGVFGARNSPTALNAFLLTSQFWDGRAETVEEQAKGPLVNPKEMAMPDLDAVAKKVESIQGYADSFKTAYADQGGKPTIDNIAHAIGAFERTLLTPSKWDNYLKGDVNALNEQEKRGVKAFIDNACITCHTGATLSNGTFQKFGLVKGPYWNFIDSKEPHDEGLFEVTKKDSDKYFFRVPGLRNVAKTAPYFHNGATPDLATAVSVMAETQLGKTLSQQEVEDIVAFLNTLTGEVPADALKVPELPE